MNIVFICQSLNTEDVIIADTISRVRELANNQAVTSVDVVCLEADSNPLRNNIFIHPLRRGSQNRLLTLLKFYITMLSILRAKKIDWVYTYMVGFYPILLFPLKLIFQFKIIMWYGHTIVPKVTRFCIRYLADKWLTANKSMVTFDSPNLRLVGQGVDTKLFRPLKIKKQVDLITVGRITPIKHLELIIEALHVCKEQFGKTYTLTVVGNCYTEKDHTYFEDLKNKIAQLHLQRQISFPGTVPHSQIPRVLQKARVFVFAVPGGVGKASLEAMACGMPLIIAAPHAEDFFGKHLSSWFLCQPKAKNMAHKIFYLLEADQSTYDNLRESMLTLVNEKYTLPKLFDRIVSVMSE